MIAPDLKLSEYVAKFYLNVTFFFFCGSRGAASTCAQLVRVYVTYVTNDITGRFKDKIFDHLSLLASPGKAAISD